MNFSQRGDHTILPFSYQFTALKILFKEFVIPAEAGIQVSFFLSLDSRFHGNDRKIHH
jgi:hypothetical protein